MTPKAIADYFNFEVGQGTKIAIEGVPESFVIADDIYTFWKEFDVVPRTGGLNVIYLGNAVTSGLSGENELDAEWSGVCPGI